jgi:hypothetical protein
MLKQVLFCGLSVMASSAVFADSAADTSTLSQQLIDKINANIGSYIGDYDAVKINPLLTALQSDLSNEVAYQALLAASTDNSYMNMPIDGHFYRITSAFPYFAGDYLKETYYTFDYHPNQDRQRVYFHAEEAEENEVPSFWIFDRQEKKNGTDADTYYYIRAVNSGLVMRRTGQNTVVDTREDTDAGAGLYTIVKDDFVVYDHAVALKSHYNNDSRSLSIKPYLGTYTVNQGDEPDMYSHEGEETDLRDGCVKLPPTDDYVQGANNWRITEVTTLPVFFYHEDEYGPYHDCNGVYYAAVCYPFAVQIPDGLKAYSAGLGLVKGGTKVELTEFETPDHRNDVIPANSPAIIKSDRPGTYYLTILYGAKYKAINFGLEGAITPVALDSNDIAYVIHDDGDDMARLVTEGVDYSYDNTISYKDFDKAPWSIYNSESTYIIPANTAYVSCTGKKGLDDYTEIEDLGLPTTGVEDVTIDAPGKDYVTDGDGNPVYYDICGRRVANPTAGLYILSNGKKIIVK